jgi:hypothetical protein
LIEVISVKTKILIIDKRCNPKCGWTCAGCPFKNKYMGKFEGITSEVSNNMTEKKGGWQPCEPIISGD